MRLADSTSAHSIQREIFTSLWTRNLLETLIVTHLLQKFPFRVIKWTKIRK
jgi:hypothetical protein